MNEQNEWNNIYEYAEKNKLAKYFRNRVYKLSMFYDRVNKEDKILDLGSGDGRFLIELYDKGYRNIVGIEPDTRLFQNTTNFKVYNKKIENISIINWVFL